MTTILTPVFVMSFSDISASARWTLQFSESFINLHRQHKFWCEVDSL
ncbi:MULTISPECIES: hypothetical protein [unclassified Okeania]|nr:MULTISPECIES: hypothetical protein [unclassified Okeania]NET18635.1 hypothetical protein [Okeania sp. SIO1H5]